MGETAKAGMVTVVLVLVSFSLNIAFGHRQSAVSVGELAFWLGRGVKDMWRRSYHGLTIVSGEECLSYLLCTACLAFIAPGTGKYK